MIRAALAAIGGLALAGAAEAADCDPGKAPGELSGDEAQAVYDCIKDELHAGYTAGAAEGRHAELAGAYRGWTPASRVPAAPGFHGGRFLLTWVNDVGDEAYLQYAEDPEIPVGTLIAKESFEVSDEGKVVRGPLFLMEKVAEEKSPDTNGWYYMMVGADGAPQGIDPWVNCNECHMGNFGHQGGLGYPVEEARITN